MSDFKFDYETIEVRRDLAKALHVDLILINKVLFKNSVDTYYESFSIPKKNGGTREINASTGDLKFIQKRLVGLLWERQKSIWKAYSISPNISHAFQQKKSIYSNAKIHRNKKCVINIDLEDFFGSIHFGRVKGFFEKNKYFSVGKEAAFAIANIVCYKGRLPQGAPSSPIITNLICNILDYRILKIAKKYRLDYTRYADDLTFSTNSKLIFENMSCFFLEITREIEKGGFKINGKKTRVIYKNSRQEVTGLIVNKKIAVKREYYKFTRAMATSLYRDNVFFVESREGKIAELEGRFAFINQIDKCNRKAGLITSDFTSREKQFTRFLFYKYFFAPKKPVIITEGKTDIRYIKAALKANYKRYPDLITLNKSGDFSYHIYFFNKTNQTCHLFKSSRDGGDACKEYILNYVTNNCAVEWFKKFTGREAGLPVIMILDNEEGSDAPLTKIIRIIYGNSGNYYKKDKNFIKGELNKIGSINIKDNLYLATIPKNDKCDIEIEDLLEENYLSTIKIKERTYHKGFEKADGWNKEKHFSKNALSIHVLKNYRNINFDTFRPFIDEIQRIVSENNKIEL